MCKILAEINEIKEIITIIRERRSEWKLSPRKKNINTLISLGMDEEIIFDTINEQLEYQDYVSGPEPDKRSIPGEVWIFGLTISNEECYLKFQDRPSGIVMWISIHKALYPLSFPYK